MSSYGHFSVLLSFFLFVTLFIASLPGVSTYLFPLHFHVVRVAFSFPAMSYSTDNFFLQTACADCIKKPLVSAVAVYLGNSFWSCFIQKRYVRSCVLLVLYLSYIQASDVWFQASLMWTRC